MQVLFFIYSLAAGGAERVAANLANHWAAKGFGITILTLASIEQDFYALHPKVQRIALGLDADSGNIRLALLNNLRRVRSLRAVLREQKPDVAVAMMATANCLLAWAGRGTGVPTIGSERTFPPAMPLGMVWEWLRRRSYPQLDALVAQTTVSADWLRRHAPAKNIEVIPNPIIYPLARHEPNVAVDSVLLPSRSRRILLTVGRLSAEKGYDRLLTVFADRHRRYPEWMLVMLGEGPQRVALEQQAEKLGIVKNVLLPGTVGNVGDWFEAADLYVLTSRFEGFPNTLLEALAHGLPSVAVDCETGPRDIVRHGIDGLLVPQDDPSALSDALNLLMGDEALRARFAERAVEARERFAVERVAAMWEALFQHV